MLHVEVRGVEIDGDPHPVVELDRDLVSTDRGGDRGFREHRIGTADVESALVSHHAVGEAGVVGIPDELKGEEIKAFVVLRAGFEANDELHKALFQQVRNTLGPIATPKAIDFVPSLPKTRSGKIMRRVLKAQEMGVDPGDLTTLED